MKDATRRKRLKKRKDFARAELHSKRCACCGFCLTVSERRERKKLAGAIVCRVCLEKAKTVKEKKDV